MFEIGNSLREARVRQQLELGEVELATKIRARYLRALEEETFDALPAQTYVKGFLRSTSTSSTRASAPTVTSRASPSSRGGPRTSRGSTDGSNGAGSPSR